MKNFSFIILFFSFSIYSQDIDSLKKLDTIYIPYHGKENEKKHNIQTRIIPTDFREKSFNFQLKNIFLSFFHVEFKGWEKKDTNIKSQRKIVNKAFLKRIRNKIIMPELINQYNNEEINCEILAQNKVFYILDFTEKKRKTILYEVVYMGYCPAIE
ncbi:hypothetical protein BB050_02258 [Flavobacterium anhuiense]|uniref:Uncharacterized protein n=1 Tax=Flavobacterium anhuiense TaxID=459526 RepID=A0AAC9D4L3_9FLAO|nr:hypothetical protein [Flavobacterium anhuiense]AOC95372.1 hypothetical protein BB050_02258 [Flavobacterium anhuiense]